MTQQTRKKQAAERVASIDAFQPAFGAVNEEAAESSITEPPPSSQPRTTSRATSFVVETPHRTKPT